MGQKQSRRISAEDKANFERQKAEWEQRLQTMSETMDELVQEKMEIQKAECEQRLAVMSHTIDKLILEKMEEKAECRPKLADMSESINKRVLEKTEILKAKCEQRLAVMSQTIEKLAQEKMEEKAEFERKLANIQETIDKRVLERTEVIGQMDPKVAALEKRTLQLEQAARRIYMGEAMIEPDINVMAETIDLLILATVEGNVQMNQSMVSLEAKIRELQQNFWSMATGNARAGRITNMLEMRTEALEKGNALAGRITNMLEMRTEALEKGNARAGRITNMLEMRTEALEKERILALRKIAAMRKRTCVLEQSTQVESQELAAMSQTIDHRVLDKTEDIAGMDQKVAVLEERTAELEQAARAMSAEKAEHEQKLVNMSERIDKLVQEKTKENLQKDLGVDALTRRILRLEQEASEKVPEFKQKLLSMSKEIDSLALAKERESLAVQEHLAILTESIKSLLLEKRLESMEFQEEPATMSEKIDVPFLRTTQEKTTAESVDPIPVEPSTSGYYNLSSVRSNSSSSFESYNSSIDQSDSLELLMSQRPQPDRVSSEERTAAQDSSTESLGIEPSLKRKRKTKHCEQPERTPDEWLLDPDLEPELQEVFMLMLNSDERAKIINGLELIPHLAQYQPEVLISKMEEVCMVILREVLNQSEHVSFAALHTLVQLLYFLEGHFDPYLDWVVDALLEKATSSSEDLREVANAVLGHLILCSNQLCCIKALLNGLRKQDPGQEEAVRECVAAHLLTLVESVGSELLLNCDRKMRLHFITTVSDLTQDTSVVVRP